MKKQENSKETKRERQDNEQNTEERGQREDDKAKKTCLMDAGMEKGMTETGKERWIDSGWKEKQGMDREWKTKAVNRAEARSRQRLKATEKDAKEEK